MGVKLKRKANSRYKRKVTRTVKTTREILPKRVQADAIKEKYDKNKTMLQNLNQTDLKEMFGKNLPTHIPDAPLNPPKVSERDARVCEKLHAKFGNDFAAMARFHKLNIFQWTEPLVRCLLSISIFRFFDLYSARVDVHRDPCRRVDAEFDVPATIFVVHRICKFLHRAFFLVDRLGFPSSPSAFSPT